FGGLGGERLEVHGAQPAEEKVAGVSHDGGASRGDAVLCLEDEQAGKEIGDVGGGLELGDGAEEFAADGRVSVAGGGTSGVEQAEAGVGIVGQGAALATGGGAVAAARHGVVRRQRRF